MLVTKEVIFFLHSRNPVNSKTEAIEVEFATSSWNENLISALISSGYTEIPDYRQGDTYYFLPCPVGTFSNSSSQDIKGCTLCPPGMQTSFTFFL